MKYCYPRLIAKCLCAAFIIALVHGRIFAQNVGINSTGTAPNGAAILDLNTGNTFTSPNGMGLLIPNVALSSTTDATTIASPPTSLIIYNTATAGTSPNDVVPGFYYNAGNATTPQWVPLTTNNTASSGGWSLTGNAGTTAGTNYIGTNDATDLVFKTVSTTVPVERMRIKSGASGAVDIGNSTGTSAKLMVTSGSAAYDAITATNSTTGTSTNFHVVEGDISNLNTAPASPGQGYLGYYSSSNGNDYSVYGTGGTWSGYFDNKVVIGGSGQPSQAINVNDLEVVNTVAGATNPANLMIRQSTALTTTDDVLGNLDFGDDAESGTQAQIQVSRDASGGAGDLPTRISFWTIPDGTATLTERMRINNAGYVGVNTTAPTTLLDVAGGTASTTQTIATITGNSLTTGKGLSITSSSLTTGNLLDVEATNSTTGSTSNGIYVTNSSTSGNAIQAVSTLSPNYSTIFADGTTSGTGGSGFDISTSNHAIAGEVHGSDSYSFAVYGKIINAPLGSGGVIGVYNATNTWGALGYHTLGGAQYSVYASFGNGYNSSGTGRLSSPTSQVQQGFGLGIYGDMMGGWIRGSKYGLEVKGDRYGLYVDGKTYTNDIIAELNTTDNSNTRVTTYVPTSTSVDVYTKGTAKLENGKAHVSFGNNFSGLISSGKPVIVTVTPMGNSNGVYVASVDATGFTVVENNGGHSNVPFSWIASGIKKNTASQEVPQELLSKDYDQNMNGVMHNENDLNTKATPMWWDGNQLQFTPAPVIDNGTSSQERGH